jgi:hypothetical protein
MAFGLDWGMDSEELLALVGAGIAVAAGLALRFRQRPTSTRRLLRRAAGFGALLGAAALALAD